MTAPPDTSFDYVIETIETACVQTITILYIYFYVSELDLRLKNIIHYLSLIIIVIIIKLLNYF